MGKAMEEFTNSVAGAGGAGLAGSLLAPIGQQLGYGIGKLTGYNKALERDQLRQQQALTDIQSNANLGLMKESYKQQKALWEATNAPAEVAQLKAAGLNPGLMYKGAGMGSTGGGGASVGGGQASDTSSRMNAQSNTMGMGMSLMKLQSEIDLNKATAEKLRAEAQTTNEVRSDLVSKMYEEGKGQFIKNAQERYKMLAGEQNKDVTWYEKHGDKYGFSKIDKNSIFTTEIVSNILQTQANTGNQDAQALLTNKKAEYAYMELLNATAHADADLIKAKAQDLATNWVTGDYTNWRTWVEIAKGVTKDIIGTLIK